MLWKHKNITLAFKAIVACASLAGLLICFGITEGKLHLNVLNFFTILSSALVCIYFIIDFIYMIKNKTPGKEFSLALKHTALFGILLTGIIANTLLVGQLKLETFRDISVDLLLHKVVPLLTFLDFILFEKHGQLKWTHPIISMLFPVLYLIYTEIIVNCFAIDVSTDDPKTLYPYQFLDPAINGVTGTIIIIVAITVSFVAIGYIFFAIDKLLAKLSK